MSDFLTKMKKDFFKRLVAGFLVGQIPVLCCFLLYPVLDGFLSTHLLVLLFLAAEGIAFFLFILVIRQFIESRLESREAISRSLFKNTRNIINNISHEWRTPLNAIMGFADELYSKEEDPSRKEALKAVRSNSVRLYSMSKKLIDFSSIETGLFNIDKQYHSVDSLLVNLKNKHSEFFEEKRIRLEIENKVPPDYKLLYDFHTLFEILDMLLENALKFTEKGYVRLEAAYEEGSFSLSVIDSGCGIEDGKKRVVFQLYRQGNSDMDREFEGIGMGLTIAGKLTEMHGGFIRVVDNKPEGTVFIVSFKSPFRDDGNRIEEEQESLIDLELTEGQKALMSKTALILQDSVKVFDAGKIKSEADKLADEDPVFRELSDKLKKTAATFDESEFARIVEEMLKDSEI